jgi:hypothetical protein
MSLETVELWRPRIERGERLRRGLVTLLLGVLMLGSLAAALMLRRPLVLVWGLVAVLALACAIRWWRGAGGPSEWIVLLPRRWVSRRPGDRRGASPNDRRATARGRAPGSEAASAACNPQRARRRVAIGGPPRL